LFKIKPPIILTLLLSLTLISVNLGNIFPPSLEDRLTNGEIANILLIGIDARPDEINARSDTIMLLSINNTIKKAALISIPRDTHIVFEHKNRKINMVNQLKGPDALCKEVSTLLDTEVEHYILTNFTGFQEIIDQLGGVYLDVDIVIHSPASGVFLNKGYHCLSGKEALTYVRFRTKQDGDIGRIQRQQRLLIALCSQLFEKDNIFRLPGVISTLKENINTNISPRDMIYLSRLASDYKPDDLITQTLPGYHYFAQNSGASLWEADREIAKSLIDSLFNGHRYEPRLDPPP